jgi:hypothetical protein
LGDGCVGWRGVVFAGGAVEAVVYTVGVEQSVEVAAGFGDRGVGSEAGRAEQ